jgi:hypothetical protein
VHAHSPLISLGVSGFRYYRLALDARLKDLADFWRRVADGIPHLAEYEPYLEAKARHREDEGVRPSSAWRRT